MTICITSQVKIYVSVTMDMVFVKWSNMIFTMFKTDKWLVSKLFKEQLQI